jgi:hypothetical protein
LVSDSDISRPVLRLVDQNSRLVDICASCMKLTSANDDTVFAETRATP